MQEKERINELERDVEQLIKLVDKANLIDYPVGSPSYNFIKSMKESVVIYRKSLAQRGGY